MLKTKNINIALGLSAVIATPLIVTSCNINTSREQKDLHLESKDFKSKDFKTITNYIQNTVQNELFKNYYSSFVIKNAQQKTNAKTKAVLDVETSSLSKVLTKQDANRFFLNEQSGKHGNFGSSYISWAMDELRENTLISKTTQLLLNKISTLYNRTIVVHPTVSVIKEGLFNNIPGTKGKYLHAEFKADLQTPMKRRYMRELMVLKVDIPVIANSKAKTGDADAKAELERLRKITAITNPASIKNSMQLKELLNETIFKKDGFVSKFNDSIIKDQASFNSLIANKEEIYLSDGIFPIENTNHYAPSANTTGKVDLTNGKVASTDKTYTFGKNYNNALVNLNKTFSSSQKVSEITNYITKTYFTNSKQAYFKNLFNEKTGTWNVKVVARTWAGNEGSNYFVSDWIENLGHRTNYFYYFQNKQNPSEAFYIKGNTSLVTPKEGN